MQRRWLPILVAFVGIIVSQMAHAATLADIRLVPDGSATPPGDVITLSLGLSSADRAPSLRIRAFLIPPDGKATARVLAAGEKNRTATGEWELVQKLEPADRNHPSRELSVTIPYAELSIPAGTHKLGYEVAVLLEGQPAIVRPTPLTLVKISEKPRTKLTEHATRLETVATTGKVKYYLGGQRRLGPNEALDASAAEATVKRPREVADLKEVAVNIPGGFERETIVDVAARTGPEVTVPEPPASAGWIPLSEIASDKQRFIRFITNRAPAAPPANAAVRGNPSQMFTNTVDSKLNFGHCLVNVPVTSHRKGQLEMPGGWWQPRDTKNVFQVESIAAFDQDAFLRGVGPGDVLLFVHGYNNSFEGSVLRAAQFHYDLDFPGNTIAFSWPSLGNTFKYTDDTEAATKSYKSLAEALRVLTDWRTAAGGNRRIHLVAHSLGNRVLLNGLYEFTRSAPAGGGRKPFGQIVLAAPDVGAAMFNNLLQTALDQGEQVTYYYCQNDGALKLSQTQNHYEPVGLYPYFQRGLITVNADSVDTTFMGHLYFAGSTQVLLDLELLLRGGLAPAERMPPLAGRDTLFGHEYWTFAQRLPAANITAKSSE